MTSPGSPAPAGAAAVRIIGRDDELSRLQCALDALLAGHSRAIALRGEPGSGKTLLLTELCRRARAQDVLTLDGRASRSDCGIPFGIIADALGGWTTADGAPIGFDGDWRAELEDVLASLVASGAEPGIATRAHGRPDEVLGEMIQRASRARPVVLALDDLQWADADSLELVSGLLRLPLAGRLLVALAYRFASDPLDVDGALAGAARPDGLIEIELPALTRAQADDLLRGADIDAVHRDALYRASGGNPFYLGQLARTQGNGSKNPSATSDLGVEGDALPPVLVAAVESELSARSAHARALARAGALVGEPFAVPFAAYVADQPEHEALDAVQELLGAQLLRSDAHAAPALRFRCPVVGQAVLLLASEGWRLTAHARAAAYLAAANADIALRAHHVERSARWGDKAAIALLRQAGESPASQPRDAAAWFAAALRLLPDDAPGQERLELLVGLARALAGAGQLAQARAKLADGLRLVETDSPSLLVKTVGAAVRIDHMLGRHGDARALLHQALATFDGMLSTGSASLRLELAIDYWFSSEWEKMAACAGDVLRDALALNDPSLVGAARSLCSLGHYVQGSIADASRHATEAAKIVDTVDDDRLSSHIEALIALAHTELGVEQYAAAGRHLERGIRISRAGRQRSWALVMICLDGIAKFCRGELAGAEQAADEVLAACRPDQTQLLIWAWALRCWVATARGDIQFALQAGERAIDLTRGASPRLFSWQASCCLAGALIEAGDPERAKREILEHAGGDELSAVEPSWRPRAYELLACAELAVGAIDAASRWVIQAEQRARELGLVGRVAEARRARARLALASGDPQTAATAAREAASAFEGSSRPIEAARAQTLHARALISLGDRDAALDELKVAHATLAQRGAARYRDEAARELRGLGLRVPRTGRRARGERGIASLSDRQREIAELVASGLTNRQIARELFLSEKTIESQLSHVFAKLDVSSRAEVAAAIERERA